ncbi:MAG: DUF928 domain-containing protein, partial [Kovacikia sp.]
GSTVSAYPTLWFYLPYSVTETRLAELRVEEHQGQYIFDRTIATITQASAGVIGISLPPGKMAPLEVGEPRYFKFVIRCDPQDSSANKFVSITVQRIPLSPLLQDQLTRASFQEKVKLYGNAGIWFETVTTVAEGLQQSPTDSTLRPIWTRFLRDLNLPPRDPQPIITLTDPSQAQQLSFPQKSVKP